MREVFSSAIKDERVTVAEGTFETTGVQDGWADLVVIAQVCFSHLKGKLIYYSKLTSLIRHFIGAPITPVPQPSLLES
jgi:hypothetical protein